MGDILKQLKQNDHVVKMKDYVQHKDVTTYEHCFHVADIATKIDSKFNLNSNLDVLHMSCVLHDFYLYDWHDDTLIKKPSKWHGFSHPKKAMDNADYYFDVSDDVKNAIKSHMWPLTIWSIPKSKEAWIVCLADKIATVTEVLSKKNANK